MERYTPVESMSLPSQSISKTAFQSSNSAFDSGSVNHPISVAKVTHNTNIENKLPIVMIHGGFHTGRAYLDTPDGREGWAQLFARRGHQVFVPDWPAHGNSPGVEKIAELGSLDVARSLAELVHTVGKCILLAHSAGGPLAWWLAESLPDQVTAIVGIAPGPPANMLPDLSADPAAIKALRNDVQAGCPVYSAQGSAVAVDPEFIQEFWANSPRFPSAHFDAYAATIVPESPRILNERFNIGGVGLKLIAPKRVGQRPILVVTGELDLRHPRQVDSALADFLQADFFWLPDKGIHGNGHMLMIEDNSHEIATLLMQWLASKGF